MKKIYTKSVFEFNKKTGQYELNHAESEYHFVNDDYPIVQMKGGGKGNNNVTIQRSDPWAPLQPYLKQAFGDASDAFLNQPQKVAPFSQDTQAGFGLARKLATEGSLLDASATGSLDKTLRGDFLYGGDGFNKAMDAAKHTILPEVDSVFEKSGRSGSGLAATAKTQALSDAFAKQYGQERQNQMEAARLAPVVRGMRYADADVLSKIGGLQEAKTQEGMDARKNAIMNFFKTISGASGGAGTSTTTGPGDSGMTGLLRYLAGAGGGALAGFGFGGPFGALAGGGLGLLGALR